jgi:2-hydroxyacyl-CoA lyase 1
VRVFNEIPRPYTSKEKLAEIVKEIRVSRRPLIIIGKGCAYAQAEKEINKLTDKLKIPFLPTPMGKGVVDDDSPYCVNSARSKALKEADLVLLLGARPNWMLHFASPPRFSSDLKIVQVDVCAEELGNNSMKCIPVQADLKSFAQQVTKELKKRLANKRKRVFFNIFI